MENPRASATSSSRPTSRPLPRSARCTRAGSRRSYSARCSARSRRAAAPSSPLSSPAAQGRSIQSDVGVEFIGVS
eukprot:31315-Pelagococcus_subviridis.AAC.17